MERRPVERAARHAMGQGASEQPAGNRLAIRACHSHPAPLFAHPRGKEFVDLDEDLTLADLANAAQEGFDSVELLKRYSTVGMGPSQGKLSNLNAARQLAQGDAARPAIAGPDHCASALAAREPRRTGRCAIHSTAPHRARCLA